MNAATNLTWLLKARSRVLGTRPAKLASTSTSASTSRSPIRLRSRPGRTMSMTASRRSTRHASPLSRRSTASSDSLVRSSRLARLGLGLGLGQRSSPRRRSRSPGAGLPWSLEKCDVCQANFTEYSLPFHAGVCQRRRTHEEDTIRAHVRQQLRDSQPPRRPPGTVCHICGRRFTTASWPKHEPICLNKWIQWNSRMPRGHQRSTKPTRPQPTEDQLADMVEAALKSGRLEYTREHALDDVFLDASRRNELNWDVFG
ncbi:unnamed protein product [Protopolystoma xenopodis]|uniref:Uncharacterized protein n=1 Tax=Protopolystoma xenopodis TaxID=117903 RepID=A0A448XPV7_9PLAT|nr:unnamed protein product [Protopolystoma xenopodis]